MRYWAIAAIMFCSACSGGPQRASDPFRAKNGQNPATPEPKVYTVAQVDPTLLFDVASSTLERFGFLTHDAEKRVIRTKTFVWVANGLRQIAQIEFRAKPVEGTRNWKFAVWAYRLVMPGGGRFDKIEAEKLVLDGDHSELRDDTAQTIYRTVLTRSSGNVEQ